MHIRDGLQTRITVSQRYQALVDSGAIKPDQAQREAIAALDDLAERVAARKVAHKSSALGWLFGKQSKAIEPVKGLYIHGGVGRGKTMLMDLFFDCLPLKAKRRAHFNEFMADVHDRVQKQRLDRKEGRSSEDDPIPPVARDLAAEASVVCFDEFTVTDIADAMILSRLFSALFAQGVVLVATSNVAPQDLYRDGLNRQLFLPFIETLAQHTRILPLDSGIDYRRQMMGRIAVYVTPLGPNADVQMDAAWIAVTEGAAVNADEIPLKGRVINVPAASGSSARFEFADLCAKPLGARDFLAIAARYKTILIDHVPVMEQANRNEAKRFILLIDTLYDQGIRLIASAAAAPEKLYAGTSGVEVFEFERTASRLTEMQSKDWLEGWTERYAPSAQAS